MVLLLFIIPLSWYSLAVAPLSNLITFFTQFFSKFLTDFFAPSSRTTQVFLTQPVSNISTIFSLGIFAIANFFLVVGLIGLVIKPRKMGIDPKYRLFSIVSAVILLFCLILPNFAPSLDLSRFYEICLLILVPFFVLGFNSFVALAKQIWLKTINKKSLGKRYVHVKAILLCALLICFLLTQTGFVNRIIGSSPLARPVDLDRIEASDSAQVETSLYQAYISEQDIFSAVWLSNHTYASSTIYADYVSTYNVLTSYGLMQREQIIPLETTTMFESGSYVYLGQQNIVLGVLSQSQGPSLNFSDTFSRLNGSSIVYSNGESEILLVNR
jgi:uncharacterized membrane protein